MATYAKTSFNAARYAVARPTYPQQLFDFVFRYHERDAKARWETAVDLGCGTGQATIELKPFQHVIGTDPSNTMIEQAKEATRTAAFSGKLEFKQAKAEELTFLEDSSVDLITSAQSAHWYDWTKVWKEAARVLRPHGTLAAWGYSEFRLPRYPSAAGLIHAYSRGTDATDSIGPHWEQPGRSVVDDHLVAVPDPDAVVPGAFRDFERVYFSGDYHAHLLAPRPIILRKTVTWDGLLDYLRSSSAFHTHQAKFPQDKENPAGDVAKRFRDKLMEYAAEQDGGAVPSETDEVVIEWPVALLLARRV